MKKVCFFGFSAMLFLSACGESAQEKLARITLEKQKISNLRNDAKNAYVSCGEKAMEDYNKSKKSGELTSYGLKMTPECEKLKQDYKKTVEETGLKLEKLTQE